MKTISIRMLAATIKDLREPVEVVTIDKASRQVIHLGVFLPKESAERLASAASLEKQGVTRT